jgi:hypothetical protein
MRRYFPILPEFEGDVSAKKEVIPLELERGRNGFDGIDLWLEGVPGSELPLNDRKNTTANTQFAFAA